MPIFKNDLLRWLNGPDTYPKYDWFKKTNLIRVLVTILNHIPTNLKLSNNADPVAFLTSIFDHFHYQKKDLLTFIFRGLQVPIDDRDALKAALQGHINPDELLRARGEAAFFFKLGIPIVECFDLKPDHLPPEFLLELGSIEKTIEQQDINALLQGANKAKYGPVIAEYRLRAVMHSLKIENPGQPGINLALAIQRQYAGNPEARAKWQNVLLDPNYSRERVTEEINSGWTRKNPSMSASVFMDQFVGLAADRKQPDVKPDKHDSALGLEDLMADDNLDRKHSDHPRRHSADKHDSALGLEDPMVDDNPALDLKQTDHPRRNSKADKRHSSSRLDDPMVDDNPALDRKDGDHPRRNSDELKPPHASRRPSTNLSSQPKRQQFANLEGALLAQLKQTHESSEDFKQQFIAKFTRLDRSSEHPISYNNFFTGKKINVTQKQQIELDEALAKHLQMQQYEQRRSKKRS